MKYFAALSVALFTSFSLLSAQNQGPQTPEQREKQILEYIDKEVQRLSSMLELEYWQEFYVDSTLTHDIHARAEEMEQMQKSKVGNADLYQDIWDRWEEQIARTYQRFIHAIQRTAAVQRSSLRGIDLIKAVRSRHRQSLPGCPR